MDVNQKTPDINKRAARAVIFHKIQIFVPFISHFSVLAVFYLMNWFNSKINDLFLPNKANMATQKSAEKRNTKAVTNAMGVTEQTQILRLKIIRTFQGSRFSIISKPVNCF